MNHRFLLVLLLLVFTIIWFMPLAAADIAPAVPTSLIIYSNTAGSGEIKLDWSDNSEADFASYKVYRSTTRGSWAVLDALETVSWYYDSDVTDGTCYWYVVTAVDDESNESDYSDDAHATPNVDDVTAPSAPTYLEANATDAKVSLSWTPPVASDLDTVCIYRSTVSGGSYDYLASVAASVTWYDNTGLTNGVRYYYVITGVDTSNNESTDSNEAYATPTGAAGGSGEEGYPDVPSGGTTAPGAPEPSGCFIATAAYETSLAEEVKMLSRFRDEFLLRNTLGRIFVKTYYKISPDIAGFIQKRPLAKKIIRLQLKPVIFIANLFVSNDKVW